MIGKIQKSLCIFFINLYICITQNSEIQGNDSVSNGCRVRLFWLHDGTKTAY